MFLNKHFIFAAPIFSLIILGATTSPLRQDEKPKNLKVLSKDISNAKLDTIMNEYSDALGVKCNYCHSPLKQDVIKLDYAADTKPAKDIARDMMRMTLDINRLFFKNNKGKNGDDTESVSCITCHNGQEYPAFKK